MQTHFILSLRSMSVYRELCKYALPEMVDFKHIASSKEVAIHVHCEMTIHYTVILHCYLHYLAT